MHPTSPEATTCRLQEALGQRVHRYVCKDRRETFRQHNDSEVCCRSPLAAYFISRLEEGWRYWCSVVCWGRPSICGDATAREGWGGEVWGEGGALLWGLGSGELGVKS